MPGITGCTAPTICGVIPLKTFSIVGLYTARYHIILPQNPPTEEVKAAELPAFGPSTSRARYGTIIAHASSVQLVVHMRAIMDELLRANAPLATVHSITTIRHDQPERCLSKTSLPRLPLAMCKSAEAVEREAETIAKANSC